MSFKQLMNKQRNDSIITFCIDPELLGEFDYLSSRCYPDSSRSQRIRGLIRKDNRNMRRKIKTI